jgi:hypothetical protein
MGQAERCARSMENTGRTSVAEGRSETTRSIVRGGILEEVVTPGDGIQMLGAELCGGFTRSGRS